MKIEYVSIHDCMKHGNTGWCAVDGIVLGCLRNPMYVMQAFHTDYKLPAIICYHDYEVDAPVKNRTEFYTDMDGEEFCIAW